MPDERGFLAQDEKRKVVEFLQSKWGDRARCQGCGESHWGVGDIVVSSVPMSGGGGLVIGGPTYPFVVVFCSNCGQAAFVNAIVCGVLAGDPTPAANPPSKEVSGGQ